LKTKKGKRVCENWRREMNERTETRWASVHLRSEEEESYDLFFFGV